jgi:uncharacterized protein YjaG (DUF416 family)
MVIFMDRRSVDEVVGMQLGAETVEVVEMVELQEEKGGEKEKEKEEEEEEEEEVKWDIHAELTFNPCTLVPRKKQPA